MHDNMNCRVHSLAISDLVAGQEEPAEDACTPDFVLVLPQFPVLILESAVEQCHQIQHRCQEACPSPAPCG